MIHVQDIRNRAIRLTDERLHHLETIIPRWRASYRASQKHWPTLTGLFAHERMRQLSYFTNGMLPLRSRLNSSALS
jgi:hypothetical protein